MLKQHTFHVTGTHCASCKILIEDTLGVQDVVKNIQVDLGKETVKIETNSQQSAEELAAILTSKIQSNGYTLSVDGFDGLTAGKDDNDVIWKALPVGLVFLALFFILQKSAVCIYGQTKQVAKIEPLLTSAKSNLATYSAQLKEKIAKYVP